MNKNDILESESSTKDTKKEVENNDDKNIKDEILESTHENNQGSSNSIEDNSNDTVTAEKRFRWTMDRTTFFKYKHKQTRILLKEMEKHSLKVVELGNRVMDGDMNPVPLLFENYTKAIIAYRRSLVGVRVALLTERKLASEIWGPNNIAIFDHDTGKHTILDDIIEELLCVDYPNVYEDGKKYDKRTDTLSPVIRKRKKQESTTTVATEEISFNETITNDDSQTLQNTSSDVSQTVEQEQQGGHSMRTRGKKLKLFLGNKDEIYY